MKKGTNMKKIIILIVLVLICSCCEQQCEDSPENNHVTFYYIAKDIEYCASQTFPQAIINMYDCLDTIIYDNIFVERFTNIVDNLKVDTVQCMIDIRTVALVTRNNNTDTICFGGYFGISRDGIKMQDNDSLFDMINGTLYTLKGWRRIFDKYIEVGDILPEMYGNDMNKAWSAFCSNLANSSEVYDSE